MINYTNRDYLDIKMALIDAIPKYTDAWTDFSNTDLGMIFIEFLAGTSAMLNYYIDKEVSETRIMQATEPRNIYSNLELIGYKRPLRRCHSAKGRVYATANSYPETRYATDLVIPAYSVFTGSKLKNNKLFFTNPYPIRIKPTDTEVDFSFLQGRLDSIEVQPTSIQSYKLYLSVQNVSDFHFRVEVDGKDWEQIDNAFLQTLGGEFYSVHRDAFDNIYILFTYNYRNYIDNRSTIRIEYVTTQGDEGVSLGVVDTLVSPLIYDGRDISKDLRFTNTSIFSGGFTDEDANLSKAKAISRARTPKFLCTLEDYHNAIYSYPGVSDVCCVDMSVKGATDIKPYELKAYVLMGDNDDMALSDAMAGLQKYIRSKQDITRSVKILDPLYNDIIIRINFTVENENINLIDLEDEILTFLDPYFYQHSFSRVISREHLISSILTQFPELKTISIESPTETLTPGLGEVIRVVDIIVRGDYYSNV